MIPYQKTVFLWGLVFAAVGLILLFAPTALSAQLTQLATTLGLSGAITIPTGNLTYILSLSLMGGITGIAIGSARHPREIALYKSLLIAKLISTLGFLFLSWSDGTAWLLCAGADGFVALSLGLAHRYSTRPLVPGFPRRHKGRGPFYEVWFGKVNIAPGKAFWFRYSLLDGKKRKAAIWGVFFDREKIEAGKEIHPLEDLAISHAAFHLGFAHLNETSARGQAGPLFWDLHWTMSGPHFDHGPWLIRRTGLIRNRYSACLLDIRISGSLQVKRKGSSSKDEKTETLLLDRAPAMIGHIGGIRQARSWAWAHCNQFEGETDVVFEGLSARIDLAKWTLGPLSSFVLFIGRQQYSFSSLSTIFQAESEVSEGRWLFSTKKGEVTLSGEIIAPSPVAVVEYTDTDDSLLWCHNSNLASLKLRLVDLSKGVDRTLVAKGTAAFEWVDRTRPR
ncbi:MAG: hypothetical protein HYS22_01610 [Deltaproteobacteria bacterium]|nr:hypothetical protein [Deltaproteobacteria bacterium]